MIKGKGKWLRTARWSILLLVSMAFFACGGGGSTTPASTVISGTAAAGAPIIGTATIKDSSTPPKTRAVPIAADGKYSIDASGLTAPFMLRADGDVGGRRYSLFSAAILADVGGNINITPLTDLIVANIAGDIAANYYTSGNFSGVTPAALNSQIAAVTAELLPVLASLGLDNSINLLRTSFNTDHTKMDAVIDVLKVSIDNATKIATIINVINNSSTTQDLTTHVVTGTITDTGVATGVTDIEEIRAGFQRMSALYATSLPTPAQIDALGLFDNTDFLWDGRDFNQFLDKVTIDAPVGLSFINIAIDNAYTVGTDNCMLVSFTVMAYGRMNGLEKFVFRQNPVSHKYQGLGNQRQVEANLEVRADYYLGEAQTNNFSTGLTLSIKDPNLYLGANGVALISGPGGVNQYYVNDLRNNNFQIQNSGASWMIAMTDTQIALIPDINAVYTIKLYDNTAGAMTLKATYTETIPKRPYLTSELTVASFPKIVTTATSVGFTSGTVSATWTLPAGLQADWFEVSLWDTNWTHTARAENYNLKSGALAASATFTASQFAGWSVNGGNINLGAEDAFGRFLGTSIYF